MSDYKNIIGKPVKSVSSNLDNTQAEGQVWYNTTDQQFKNVISSKAFTSGAPLISARSDFRGTFGTQSAFKGAGGFTTTPSGNTPALTNVEDYDGTGFSSAPVLPLGTRNQGGGGTTSAGWVAGGRRYPTSPANQTNKTQEWDGSSWSEGGDLGTAKYGNSGTGTLTAGLVSGGFDNAAPGNLNQTEEYNGSSWTAQNTMGTARYRTAATGTQTATILFGGVTYPGSPQDVDNVEEYDGTSWTTLTSLPADRGMGHAFGITTNAILAGGRTGPPGASNTTLQWDGTSYTSFPTLSTARFNGGDGATTSSTAGIVAGGYSTTSLTLTEEYTQSANVITAAAWASGPALNTGGRNGSAGGGIQTAAIIAGGGLPGPSVITSAEQYNGSSWSNIPSLGTARGYMAGATNAPYTAALVFGGSTGSGGPFKNETEEYDGSSWSEQSNMSAARNYLAGFGTQTAAVAAGGQDGNPGRPTLVEEYNGSSWTNGTAIPTGAFAWGGCGTETTGLVVGDVPGKAATYNGSSWTNISYLNSSGNYNKAVGTSASAVTAGRNPTSNNQVEEWNGTTWLTQAQLATARFNGTNAGTTSSSLVAGPTTATEEFTAESAAVNVKTITTS